MTDNELIKANDILDKFDFFNQRAGRELWSDKPKYVQDKDIEAFTSDVMFLKDFINCQQAENYKLQEIIARGDFTSITALRATQDWHRRNSEHIKRLEEEIEMLMSPVLTINNFDLSKEEIAELTGNLPKQIIPYNDEQIKAEAVKEFAERLKEQGIKGTDVVIDDKVVFVDDIDNLVKEMVDKNND